MVLFPADEDRRGAAAEVLRLRPAADAIHRACGVRGSEHAAERGAAREYRGAHDSVLRPGAIVTAKEFGSPAIFSFAQCRALQPSTRSADGACLNLRRRFPVEIGASD